MEFYRIIIFAGLFALHHFLSRRNSVYWGGIFPVAFSVFAVWLLVTHHTATHLFLVIFLLTLVLLMLLIDWSEGRKALHDKRKKELDKMKSQDTL